MASKTMKVMTKHPILEIVGIVEKHLSGLSPLEQAARMRRLRKRVKTVKKRKSHAD